MSVTKVIINEQQVDIPDTMCSILGIFRKGSVIPSQVLPDMKVKHIKHQVVLFLSTEHPDITDGLYKTLQPIIEKYLKENL